MRRSSLVASTCAATAATRFATFFRSMFFASLAGLSLPGESSRGTRIPSTRRRTRVTATRRATPTTALAASAPTAPLTIGPRALPRFTAVFADVLRAPAVEPCRCFWVAALGELRRDLAVDAERFLAESDICLLAAALPPFEFALSREREERLRVDLAALPPFEFALSRERDERLPVDLFADATGLRELGYSSRLPDVPNGQTDTGDLVGWDPGKRPQR